MIEQLEQYTLHTNNLLSFALNQINNVETYSLKLSQHVTPYNIIRKEYKVKTSKYNYFISVRQIS